MLNIKLLYFWVCKILKTMNPTGGFIIVKKHKSRTDGLQSVNIENYLLKINWNDQRASRSDKAINF